MKLQFRAKQANGSGEYYFGMPFVEIGRDANYKDIERWFMKNYELCICTQTNRFYSENEQYKATYSGEIIIDTLEVSIDGKEWESCKLSNLGTINYKPI